MAFCYNCGKPLAAHDRFCAECGSAAETAPVIEGKAFDRDASRCGYIYTNVAALSGKLGVPRQSVLDLIEFFVEGKNRAGVSYSLIDASNYTPLLPENRSAGRVMKLSPHDSWQTHQNLLTDSYVYDSQQNSIDVDYVFIVGGNDIIPMPEVENPCKECDDTLDTDIPYGYLYGAQTEEMLRSGNIFYYKPMMHVGRLPLGTDGSFEDMVSYFERALDVTCNGFRQTFVYGQSDPNWKGITSTVVREVNENGNMTPFQDSAELAPFIYKSLVLSPEVDTEYIDRFLPSQAVLYYFNMHGSGMPQNSGFYGEDTDGLKTMTEGISPHHWNIPELNNVVVTEACYGGKFIDLSGGQSMLLSALRSNTLLYVGSSRPSYGMVDRPGDYSQPEICCADVIARTFIIEFLSGRDAGSALFLAKSDVLGGSIESVADLLTVMEFNLFGDPTLTISPIGAKAMKGVGIKSVPPELPKTMVAGDVNTELKVRQVYADNPRSILAMARQAVNNSFEKTNKIINDQLYSRYNIKPRRLSSVFESQTTGRAKRYIYNYDDAGSGSIYVELDDKNNIIKVVTTK